MIDEPLSLQGRQLAAQAMRRRTVITFVAAVVLIGGGWICPQIEISRDELRALVNADAFWVFTRIHLCRHCELGMLVWEQRDRGPQHPARGFLAQVGSLPENRR
jgi:hypothetical protein